MSNDDIGEFCDVTVIDQTDEELVGTVLVKIDQKVSDLIVLILKVIRNAKLSEGGRKPVVDTVPVVFESVFVPIVRSFFASGKSRKHHHTKCCQQNSCSCFFHNMHPLIRNYLIFSSLIRCSSSGSVIPSL